MSKGSAWTKTKTHGQKTMLREVAPTKQLLRRATARHLMVPKGETVANGLKKTNAQEVRNVLRKILRQRPRQAPEVRAQADRVVREKEKEHRRNEEGAQEKGRAKEKSKNLIAPLLLILRKSEESHRRAMRMFLLASTILKENAIKGSACDWWHPPKCKFFTQSNCSAGKGCSFLHAPKDKAAPAPKAKADAKAKAEPAQGQFVTILLLLHLLP